ncbi:MAG TPA: FtsH protease activity modulator HflK [Burkholderiaceae bacterium]|nr:FtsH protease activity modulator HflK [Burkholderiaceae bacterium]
MRFPKFAKFGLILSNGRDGPPDLDELWRDFNRKLSGLFGGKGGGPRGNGSGEGGNGGGPNFQPDMKSAGVGVSLIAGVVALIWLGSGFFIVQEGQQAVVTSFGKYSHTADAGFQWRMPYPFQAHETVNFTQLRTKEVGRNNVVAATGLRDSSMLTQDENIVDIRFTVQYRLKDARMFLFENRDPEDAVVLAAESAVREIVGRSRIDSVLYEQRDAIAAELVKSVQNQLDRLKAGIVVVNVNVQSVQPPEQVQAAFEDTLKAGQDGDRLKKEGLAYASDVIPKAQGTAARLREEAEGYKAKTIAEAEGDARRFTSVLAEYQKAPAVTRDRMYIDTMRQVYSNVSKVLVDSRNNSNLLYLPLDKLVQQSTVTLNPTAPTAPSTLPDTSTSTGTSDARSRDNQRGRDRESR